MQPLSGKLVSAKDGGEYATRCPFTGQGDDRFHYWPSKGNWYCRKECAGCPGKPVPSGGMTGWLEDNKLDARKIKPVASRPRPTMDRVFEYQAGLDGQVLEYLAGRGIRRDTASRYLVGKNCRRLTVPNVIKNGHLACYGIKKRWIGEPPEDWIDAYTMEPGSQGKSIFNYNRLVSRTSWPCVLIVEGVLDCMLLDQLGIPAVAPFGGGGVWDPNWKRAFSRARRLIHIADDDPNGEGLLYAQRRRELMGRGEVMFPPGGCKDIGEAYQAGENLPAWFKQFE